MIKYVLKYGLLIGFINALGLFLTVYTVQSKTFEFSEMAGYFLMLIAFAMIYVGVKNYRQEVLMGYITFGSALLLGLLITLFAATIYVLVWLVVYYSFIPDFMERYADSCYDKMSKSGQSKADITQKMEEIAKIKELYKNPWMVMLITYSEILPFGIVASFVSSLVLRRKKN